MTERKSDIPLALLFAFVLALYPLLRGGWDLWAQLGIQLVLFSGGAVWLVWRLAQGSAPVPAQYSWLAATAIFLGFISLQLSPVRNLALPEYRWWCAAVALAFAAPLVPQKWRSRFETLLLTVGVATVPLALYQRFLLPDAGEFGMTGPFFNQNMYAGYLVMLLPLTVARRNWHISATLLLAFVLTGSRGAFAALAVAAALWGVSNSRHKLRWGVLLALSAAIVAVLVFNSSSVSVQERLRWWEAALRMVGERPAFGFGPGSFEYVYPAFRGPSTGLLSSVYAHSWPLQFAAEYGLACLATFLGWVVLRMRRLSGGAFWAVTAVLLHSLVDFTLYSPAIFFIFCWLLASGEENASSAPVVSPLYRAASALCIMVLAVYGILSLPKPWLLQKHLLAAKAQYSPETAGQVVARLSELSVANPDDSSAALLYASALSNMAFQSKNKEALGLAASAYERALRLNPFRPATYSELSSVYEELGRSGEARRIMRARDMRFPS